ncbi:MAG: hypothetical protein GY906_32770 [bacterium]|nr:hypothetical protein [bacterium]
MLLKQSVQVGGRRSDEIRNCIVESNSYGWRKPVKLDDTLAGPCSLSSKGDLYFSSPHLGGIGGDDIFVSELVDGQYTEPVNVGPSINTSLHEADPFIAPDQSYIVFVSADTDSDVFDLFVSFRLDDDSWSRAVTLGDQVNSTAKELLPTVTPDGKYLFFTSERRTYIPDPNNLSYDEKIHILDNPGNGWGDIYWVDAAVIESLRKRAGKRGDS